jgi:hypothetical protein
VIETSDHVIISFYLDRDPDNHWVEADDRLGPMVQARSDLAAGDLRLLCLGWLLGAQWAGQDDQDAVADTEPPVPAGLGDLSASLRAIADFLEIDKDLMAVAAETSPPLEEPANDGLAEWITALRAAAKDTLLTMVAHGEGAQAQALLLRRFRGSNTGTTVVPDQSGQQPDCERQPRAARLSGRRPRNGGGAKNRPARPLPRQQRTLRAPALAACRALEEDQRLNPDPGLARLAAKQRRSPGGRAP